MSDTEKKFLAAVELAFPFDRNYPARDLDDILRAEGAEHLKESWCVMYDSLKQFNPAFYDARKAIAKADKLLGGE